MTIETTCRLCDGRKRMLFELPHVWYQPRETRPFRLEWCDACGYGELNPRPTPQELESYYSSDYFAAYSVPERKATPRRDNVGRRAMVHMAWRLDQGQSEEETIKAILGTRRGTICDVGCGNGDLLNALQSNYEVVGVEPSQHARARAKAKGLRVLEGSADCIPKQLTDCRFDVVCLMGVLEHCLDPKASLEACAALVAKGGALVAAVPNNEAIWAKSAGPCWFHTDAGRHVNFFTSKSLRRLFSQIGLRERHLRFGGFLTQFTAHRLESERKVWDRLYGTASEAPCRRPSLFAQCVTLARGSFAKPQSKYEEIIFVAEKEGG